MDVINSQFFEETKFLFRKPQCIKPPVADINTFAVLPTCWNVPEELAFTFLFVTPWKIRRGVCAVRRAYFNKSVASFELFMRLETLRVYFEELVSRNKHIEYQIRKLSYATGLMCRYSYTFSASANIVLYNCLFSSMLNYGCNRGKYYSKACGFVKTSLIPRQQGFFFAREQLKQLMLFA